MELEEVLAIRPLLEEAEEPVGHFCRVEGWSTESQHEEQNSKREDVRCKRSAGQVLGFVDLWSHVDLGAHLLRDHAILMS